MESTFRVENGDLTSLYHTLPNHDGMTVKSHRGLKGWSKAKYEEVAKPKNIAYNVNKLVKLQKSAILSLGVESEVRDEIMVGLWFVSPNATGIQRIFSLFINFQESLFIF